MATKSIRKTLNRKGVLADLYERLTAELERRDMRMGMVYHLSFYPKSKEFSQPYFVVKLVDKSSDPFTITTLWFSGQAEVLKESEDERNMIHERELGML